MDRFNFRHKVLCLDDKNSHRHNFIKHTKGLAFGWQSKKEISFSHVHVYFSVNAHKWSTAIKCSFFPLIVLYLYYMSYWSCILAAPLWICTDLVKWLNIPVRFQAEKLMKQIGVQNVKLSEYEMSIAAHLVDPLSMHVRILFSFLLEHMFLGFFFLQFVAWCLDPVL